ncbi:MAG TPA: hypothetical protein VHD32_07550 [Candidatus Didemnitutus sp.]|nr:hypothetical protein [Candidatus Didemnitutus sp.]
MNRFCTYCDRGYAARLLCLHDSLRAHGEPFRLSVLCFDEHVEAIVAAENSPSLEAIPLRELLAADPEYAAVRPQRNRYEFYFTGTPSIVRHCFARDPAADRVTYLDADLYFFGPPSGVFAEQGSASVGIVPHRFPARLKELERHGIYNVAWVSFRRDAEGRACLDWWRERCLEWCYDRFEPGRYGDQGYLDEFPRRFHSVTALQHPGINAAPWNVDGARFSAADGQVRIDDCPLFFFHFQGIREIVADWFDPGFRPYQTRFTEPLRELVYRPYLRALATQQARLQARDGVGPVLGYHRLPTGPSLRNRWERIKGRWILPGYQRARGRLIHVTPASSL